MKNNVCLKKMNKEKKRKMGKKDKIFGNAITNNSISDPYNFVTNPHLDWDQT